jgi:CRISPR-associated protein Cmr2
MKYLFYFTFGPVQSFISQSRKTQDLYAGSRLLSTLCQTATTALRKYESTLIVPQLRLNQESLPNYLLAEIEAEPQLIKSIAEGMRQTVRDNFSQIADKCLKAATHEPCSQGFNSQIQNHLDIHWCFQPLKNDYAEAYRLLQQQLAAIKNTRCFSQVNEGEGEQGRKCSLDGERNALFYRKSAKDKPPPHIHSSARDLKKTNKLLPNEGLSAVSLVKRYYQPNGQRTAFPSTAEVALMPYLAGIMASAEGQEFKDFLDQTVRDDNAQLYFEDNLNETYFERQGLEYARNAIPELKQKLQAIPKTKIKKTPYYAVLTFDGDSMGKWLSGDFLADAEKSKLRQFHQELSRLLGNFAQWSKNHLNDPRGQAVYAGGDDFMGFVALRYVLTVAVELRQAFDVQVNQKIQAAFKTKGDLTFSAGIVLAHYKTPLHVVLATAHEMQEYAKQADNKNSFAIKTIKHSGESHQTRYPWFDPDTSFIDDLQTVISELQTHFSDTFIRVLNPEIRGLLNEEGGAGSSGVIENEIKRLVRRAAAEQNTSDTHIASLTEILTRLFRKVTPEQFLEALNICIFISRETMESQP